MGIEIELTEAQRRLAELIDSLKGGGEILIIRDGQPVARLLPVDEVGPDRVPGSAKDMFAVPDDFDAPLDEFCEYV